MNAHEIAENLCKKAEALGLCHPTESMIAEALDNVLSNHIQETLYELEHAGYKAAASYLIRAKEVAQLERELERS